MSKISDLKPNPIWQYFSELIAIPRPSKKETDILKYLKNVSEELKLPWKEDAVGNLLICKPASREMKNVETVILQSHVDMVCEKNSDSDHNFDTDPIQAFVEDGWVKAKGTTLGADNGIGVAAQLAILANQNLQCGKIECLFTVDEETGMTGAMGLSPDLLSGKILLNLDSEDDGEVFMGCAGGIDTLISFPMNFVAVEEGYNAFSLSVTGLLGGHSGDDINKGRGNANKIISELFRKLLEETSLQICNLRGGNLRNAIPRESEAILACNENSVEIVKRLIDRYSKEKLQEYPEEPGLKIELQETNTVPQKAFENERTKQVLKTLIECPNGVIEMSEEVPGLVQTSTNLASIHTLPESGIIDIVTSQRSSVASSKNELAAKIKLLFEKVGAKVNHSDAYPGWNPNPDSNILRIAEKSYQKLFAEEPKVKAIHAGLECGLFLEKYPHLDMISFGPTIRGAHSPDERLEISTVQKFWDWLLAILQSVPQK